MSTVMKSCQKAFTIVCQIVKSSLSQSTSPGKLFLLSMILKLLLQKGQIFVDNLQIIQFAQRYTTFVELSLLFKKGHDFITGDSFILINNMKCFFSAILKLLPENALFGYQKKSWKKMLEKKITIQYQLCFGNYQFTKYIVKA